MLLLLLSLWSLLVIGLFSVICFCGCLLLVVFVVVCLFTYFFGWPKQLVVYYFGFVVVNVVVAIVCYRRYFCHCDPYFYSWFL